MIQTFPQPNKYRNKKEQVDGIWFDSRKEAKYYRELKARKEAGDIKDFFMQVKYVLIPKQTEPCTVFDKKGRPVTKEKIVEHPCTYTADFVIIHHDMGEEVIDCKGSRGLDQKYPIKRKLLRWVHGIVIREV